MTRGTTRSTRALLGLLTAAALGLSACATGSGTPAAEPEAVRATETGTAATGAEPGSRGVDPEDEDPGSVTDDLPAAAEGDGADAPTPADGAASSAPADDAASSAPAPAPGDDASATSEAPDVEITIAAVGDLQLSRAIAPRVLQEGTDAPLADVRDLLREADLTIANLESPLAEGGTPETRKAWAFVAPPSFVDVLTDGGVDVVSLANNHILDYGVSAMESTQEILDEAGIVHVGVGQNIDEARAPRTVEVEGLRLGFLSYLEMPVERRLRHAGSGRPGRTPRGWPGPARR